MRNLVAHLSSLNPSQRALIVANTNSIALYESDILVIESDDSEQNCEITLVDVDKQVIPFKQDFDLVVVLHDDIKKALRLYGRCNEFKDRGIPVVFGLDQRGLCYNPPSWQHCDLTIMGMFYLASAYLQGLPTKGSYLEFGVFDGRSFSIAGHALRNVCINFHAFDSFKGIVGTAENEMQTFADGGYYANLETFNHNMKVAGLSNIEIQSIQGPFQETLKDKIPADYGINSISIVHIDSDVAEAATLALEFVASSLTDGALILFDEYHAFGANNKKGERLALSRWLDKHPEYELEIYRNYTAVSRSYIVHKT